MRKLFNQVTHKFQGFALDDEENKAGIEKRRQIIDDAQAMKRLLENKDFLRFFDILQEDRDGLNRNLLNEDSDTLKSNDVRTRLIARINQIDKVIKKPKSLIWQMENLTEVRDAIKEQSRVRQAHGTKTGGKSE